MRFCFVAALAVVISGIANAASVRGTLPAPAVEVPTSTVRADSRGRLIRTVLVPPTIVRPRPVTPRVVDPIVPGRPLPITTAADLDRLIDDTARRQGVDPLLVHAIIHVESGYNQYALSHKGAEGLMQLMPGTGRKLGVRNAFDMRQNVEGGVRYLSEMLGRFNDTRFALAAYNAGPEAVVRYNGIPPYPETQDYVYKVGRQYGDLRRRHTSRPHAVQLTVPAPEPRFRPVESFVDAQGRLHLRTR